MTTEPVYFVSILRKPTSRQNLEIEGSQQTVRVCWGYCMVYASPANFFDEFNVSYESPEDEQLWLAFRV